MAFTAGAPGVAGVLGVVSLCDTSGLLVKEALSFSSYGLSAKPVCWVAVGGAGRVLGLPAGPTLCRQGVVFSIGPRSHARS